MAKPFIDMDSSQDTAAVTSPENSPRENEETQKCIQNLSQSRNRCWYQAADERPKMVRIHQSGRDPYFIGQSVQTAAKIPIRTQVCCGAIFLRAGCIRCPSG